MYQVEETTIKYNFKYRNHLALFRLCKFIHVNVQNFELSIAYSKSTHVFIREIITFQREFPLLESPSTSRKLIHTTLLFRFHNSQDTYASTWPAVRQIACPTKSQGFVRSKWSLRDRSTTRLPFRFDASRIPAHRLFKRSNNNRKASNLHSSNMQSLLNTVRGCFESKLDGVRTACFGRWAM